MKSIALKFRILPVLFLAFVFCLPIEAQRKNASKKNSKKNVQTETNKTTTTNKSTNQIRLEPLDAASSKLVFHIGSPMFLRVKIDGKLGCEPLNGQFFYFDENDVQVGWGFEEVYDSTLFPNQKNSCERIIMLSSENSNRLAEGEFKVKINLYVNDKTKLVSNLVTLNPIHAKSATTDSYSAFLLEQLFKNNPILQDPETLKAIFLDKSLASPESEVYCSVLKFRAGDFSGAKQSLHDSELLSTKLGKPLAKAAAGIKKIILAKMQ